MITYNRSSVDANNMHMLNWKKVRDDQEIRDDLATQLCRMSERFKAWGADDRKEYKRLSDE